MDTQFFHPNIPSPLLHRTLQPKQLILKLGLLINRLNQLLLLILNHSIQLPTRCFLNRLKRLKTSLQLFILPLQLCCFFNSCIILQRILRLIVSKLKLLRTNHLFQLLHLPLILTNHILQPCIFLSRFLNFHQNSLLCLNRLHALFFELLYLLLKNLPFSLSFPPLIAEFFCDLG